MTYKKPLKRFSGTTLMGESIVAEDTADGKRLGSYAIDALEAHKTITAEDGDKKILVPFHAVKTAMYGTQTADAEKADAYCGGGTDGDTVTITVIKGCKGLTPISPAEVVTTFEVTKGEKTEIPISKNESVACGSNNCGSDIAQWLIDSGDAEVVEEYVEQYDEWRWFITANEDATIFPNCTNSN